MITRDLSQGVLDLASWYPVVSVTGPRQSGKSTLVKAVFPNYKYINLEDPATRARAQIDPSGFVASLPTHVIIDEAQYAPDLFSAIQARVDESDQMGQFVLSGSQNFQLLSAIKQSLAGRVGIAKLLPLSCAELDKASLLPDNIMEVMVRGLYPRLYTSSVPSRIFYENYLDTYVTRDVLGFLDVRNESAFRTFVKLCAARAGGILNVSGLARDAGVSAATAKNWLSMLESSYVISLVRPYSANIGKRLIKAPKLYFFDTGLLCHLLGIVSPAQLFESPMYGSIFENFVIVEQLKRHLNRLDAPDVMYYRDDSKREVDMIDATKPQQTLVVELKSGQTYQRVFSRNARTIGGLIGAPAKPMVVYGGTGSFVDDGVCVSGVREFLLDRMTREAMPLPLEDVWGDRSFREIRDELQEERCARFV